MTTTGAISRHGSVRNVRIAMLIQNRVNLCSSVTLC
jgi:hypothetical protein